MVQVPVGDACRAARWNLERVVEPALGHEKDTGVGSPLSGDGSDRDGAVHLEVAEEAHRLQSVVGRGAGMESRVLQADLLAQSMVSQVGELEVQRERAHSHRSRHA